MERLTVTPWIIALIAGFMAMPGTNVYKVCAWNAGMLRLDPWRVRSNGAGAMRTASATIRAWFASLWSPRFAVACLAVLLAALVANLSASHDGGLLLAIALPIATLRTKRAQLLREAESFKAADGTFASDAARASFDARMTEIEQCDTDIRAAEADEANPGRQLVIERPPADDGQGQRMALANDPPAEPNDRDRGAAAERERVQGIILACRSARLPQTFQDNLIRSGKSLVECQAQVFTEMNTRSGEENGPSRVPSGHSVQMGSEPFIHERKGVEEAILHRMAPDLFKLTDLGRKYRGLGLLDLGEVFLRAAGIRTTDLSKMDRAAAMLGLTTRSGMHSTSDFPLLLADVASKVLRAAYEAAPQTWVPLAKTVNLSDFKPSKQLQIGDAPQLLEVGEHGEFKSGTIAEAKEQLQIKTYGRIFAITRQALINDDTNAFAEVPMAFGRAARNKESDLAWAEITSNPDMGDTIDLFHASHNNLDASGSLISVESIGIGRAAIRRQTGIDGVTILNLNPKYLVVPASLETKADQFVSAVLNPSAAQNVNPFAGRLEVIAEPRLDVDSEEAWYLATNVAQCPVLLYGVLDGQGGPVVTQELGFEIDGLKLKCRHDVGFKAADWRGIYKNVGEAVT